MRIATYVCATFVFIIVYFLSVFVSGFAFSRYADWANQGEYQWWSRNGIPFLIFIISGTAGAIVGIAITRGIFSKLNHWRTVLIFISILTLHQVANLFLIILGRPSGVSDLHGAALAVAAIIAAVESVPSYNRK